MINCRGELELCAMSWAQGLGVSVLEADLRRYLETKTQNGLCARCLSSGFSHYRHFGVIAPELLELSATSARPSS